MEDSVASQRCVTIADLLAGLYGEVHLQITQHKV